MVTHTHNTRSVTKQKNIKLLSVCAQCHTSDEKHLLRVKRVFSLFLYIPNNHFYIYIHRNQETFLCLVFLLILYLVIYLNVCKMGSVMLC